MSKFVMEQEPKQEKSSDEPQPPILTYRRVINKEKVAKTLIKMFRAACNGKNYYKKWFPELKDTGDFEAAFILELNKLVK